jgi:hypothetical protein
VKVWEESKVVAEQQCGCRKWLSKGEDGEDMIEAPRAKTAAQEWRWKLSNARQSKDDDCAQNKGFTPAALCAYREEREDG